MWFIFHVGFLGGIYCKRATATPSVLLMTALQLQTFPIYRDVCSSAVMHCKNSSFAVRLQLLQFMGF
jgi:hypothetical protein